ncbi:pantoate--beta-alanine ligase [Methylocucumis oryzae]|uniref:pantoate--beta-alanine ligase n=1 Tax=Methylocucumis oryzae TaxID=1632867 RepID=UPI000A64641E
MQTFHSIATLRDCIKTWRKTGARIALVPTMGNLHAGHLALVKTARDHADKVIVSIFVNPTQFGVNEDYTTYPRTENDDVALLTTLAVDGVFLPSVDDMYNPKAETRVSVPRLAAMHCGITRPGHFDGVALIVCKLFNIVQPDIAVFGLKDYQQFAVITALVRDLNLPVQLLGVDTVREPNGLALSSRNQYLSTEEKVKAAMLYASLQSARHEILSGRFDFDAIAQEQLTHLQQAGFIPDYFAICERDSLTPATIATTDFVILAAAKIR